MPSRRFVYLQTENLSSTVVIFSIYEAELKILKPLLITVAIFSITDRVGGVEKDILFDLSGVVVEQVHGIIHLPELQAITGRQIHL